MEMTIKMQERQPFTWREHLASLLRGSLLI
jgi:hypothetical protein